MSRKRNGIDQVARGDCVCMPPSNRLIICASSRRGEWGRGGQPESVSEIAFLRSYVLVTRLELRHMLRFADALATSATLAPGTNVSSTIRRFSATERHLRTRRSGLILRIEEELRHYNAPARPRPFSILNRKIRPAKLGQARLSFAYRSGDRLK
jgi:hypothetical protein